MNVQAPEPLRLVSLRRDVDPPPQVLQTHGRRCHAAPASRVVGGSAEQQGPFAPRALMLKKAEAKPNADTKPLIDESKKYLAEARAHHENAKTKRDHGDAVRKAKFALALAEEAVTLQTP